MKIDYIELPVTDFAAAKAFYGRAFGWTFEDWGDDYVGFDDAGLKGGFRKADKATPKGGVLVVLYADDLDAAQQAVTQAGGKIVAHLDFPGGRRFHFTDPAGNELAIWTKVADSA
jgi:predicted enzyme related to lactoylglutathione lyase